MFLFIYSKQLMLNYFFNSPPSFEKQLEEFLTQGPNVLNDALLHKIMAAIRGEDQTVKSQIALATLKKAIASFDASKDEVRLLRQLIIFDKLVEENIYCEEISKITIFALEMNKGSVESAIDGDAFRMLRLYWKIIKQKSMVINDHDHIFHEKRSQRRHYLQRVKVGTILIQIGTLESFFASIFELAYHFESAGKSKQQEWRSGGVAQYVILHLLYKLLGLYNCQLMAHKYLVHKIADLQHSEICKLKKYILKFREHSNKFINFIKMHHQIKGFQLIHYEEIKVQINQKLIKFIDDYLQSLESQSPQKLLKAIPITMGKIVVEKKPMTTISKSNYNSRITIKNQINSSNKKQKGEGNPFSNWHNSFSHEFPQKEIMTVDLIMQLKIEQANTYKEQEDGENCSNKEYMSRCSYDNRSTNITSTYEIHLLAKQCSINLLQKVNFQNIYSKPSSKWNHH